MIACSLVMNFLFPLAYVRQTKLSVCEIIRCVCVMWRCTASGDDARRLNEQLVSELNAAQDDMKRLRQAIDHRDRQAIDQ